MIGVDTNVLVRHLTQDDPGQAAAAGEFFSRECSGENPAYINDVVACELVWVLEDAYAYSRDEIAAVLENLLRTEQVRFARPSCVWRALEQYRKSHDFSDALIGEINLESGCTAIVTFDRRASRLTGFRLL